MRKTTRIADVPNQDLQDLEVHMKLGNFGKLFTSLAIGEATSQRLIAATIQFSSVNKISATTQGVRFLGLKV